MKSLIIVLIMGLAFNIYAQTGPGGIGSNSNNVLWLLVEGNCYTDAGSTPAVNGDNVQQWNDISGNANNAIELDNNNKPNLKTNAVNGFSSLTFDGGDERILVSGVATNSQAIVFVVVKFNSFSTSNNDGVIHAGPSGTSFSTAPGDKSIGMWVNNSTGKIWGRGIQTDGTRKDLPKNTTLSTGQFYIITQDYDGTNITQYVDGTVAGSVSYDGTLNDWSEFGIGRQGNESLIGEIAEVITHKVSLNTAQRIITENYLAAQYGLTLTANDLYVQDNSANGNYDYEVAGIGRIDASNLHNDAQGSGIVRILNPSGLDNNEFLIWGHDNGIQQATETTDVPSTVEARFDRVWRVSEVNTSGTAVDVGSIDIQFDLTGLGSVTAADLRLLIDTDNDGTFADEAPISGATSLGSDVYQFAGVTAIANNLRFTIGTIDKAQTPLPIELISFEVQSINDNSVELKWKTASETNNDFFTVQRSIDGEHWENIENIQGAGNSSSLITYQTIDYSPYKGINYYRLKQTDFDGEYSFSQIRIVQTEEIKTAIELYPNPVFNKVTIKGSNSELEEVRIYNILGQDLTNQTLISEKNDGQIVLDLSSLSKGLYYVKTKTKVLTLYKAIED